MAPRRSRIRAVPDGGLAFAVVAQPPGFQNGGTADLGECSLERSGIADICKRSCPDAERINEGFFGKPILCCRQDIWIGQHRYPRRKKCRRLRWNIFELIGDD